MPVAGLCSVPFGGLLKSSRDFGIGFFVPAPLARAICWPWARKIRQWADFGRPQPSSAQLLLFSAPISTYCVTLRHKNNQVALLLVECFGGIASGGARLLRYLARRASDKKRGRDGTKYSKFHPRGYLSHHLAAISMAAVYTDAAHIADGVIGLKQRSLAANDPTE